MIEDTLKAHSDTQFEDHRSWQARLIFERTTAAERFEMIENMLTELGEDRIRSAIDFKLAARERTFTASLPNDR